MVSVQYKSNKSGDVLTGLDDYVSRMKEGQKGIYYVSAESDALAANSPFVEALQGKDLEVLFYSEAIDEWTGAQLSEYKGHKLVDVTKEGLELDEEDKKKVEQGENLLKVCLMAMSCKNKRWACVLSVAAFTHLGHMWRSPACVRGEVDPSTPTASC